MHASHARSKGNLFVHPPGPALPRPWCQLMAPSPLRRPGRGTAAAGRAVPPVIPDRAVRSGPRDRLDHPEAAPGRHGATRAWVAGAKSARAGKSRAGASAG